MTDDGRRRERYGDLSSVLCRLVDDLCAALPMHLAQRKLTELTDDRRFAEVVYRVALAGGSWIASLTRSCLTTTANVTLLPEELRFILNP